LAGTNISTAVQERRILVHLESCVAFSILFSDSLWNGIQVQNHHIMVYPSTDHHWRSFLVCYWIYTLMNSVFLWCVYMYRGWFQLLNTEGSTGPLLDHHNVSSTLNVSTGI